MIDYIFSPQLSFRYIKFIDKRKEKDCTLKELHTQSTILKKREGRFKRLLANANYINVKQTKIKVLKLHEVYSIINIDSTNIHIGGTHDKSKIEIELYKNSTRHAN